MKTVKLRIKKEIYTEKDIYKERAKNYYIKYLVQKKWMCFWFYVDNFNTYEAAQSFIDNYSNYMYQKKEEAKKECHNERTQYIKY